MNKREKTTYQDRPILVTGATCKQGGAVANALLQHGHRIRILTRNPESERATFLLNKGAEVIQGDLEDQTSVIRAMQGVGAVFSVQDFLEAGVEAEVRQGLNLLEAAISTRPDHLIYSSASTVGRNTGVPHLDSKEFLEKKVRKINVPWTIFRPAAFMENWEWEKDSIVNDGIMYHPGRADMIYRQVSVQDIAAMVVIAFEHPDIWSGNIAALCGEAMTPIEMAATFSRVLKKPISYQHVDWQTSRDNYGEDLTLMYKYFDEFGMDGDQQQLRFWHPEALSFEQFLLKTGWS